MRREEDGDDCVMADICQGEVGANTDTWEDGHLRTTAIIAARMRVACTRTFCSTLRAEISFRLLTLQIRARGYLSALSTIVIIALCGRRCCPCSLCIDSKMLSHRSLFSLLFVQGRRSTRFRVIGSGRSINQSTSRANLQTAQSLDIRGNYIHGIGTTKTATASAICEALPFFT